MKSITKTKSSPNGLNSSFEIAEKSLNLKIN